MNKAVQNREVPSKVQFRDFKLHKGEKNREPEKKDQKPKGEKKITATEVASKTRGTSTVTDGEDG